MSPHAEWHLETRLLGRRTLVFDEIDSTSSYAAALAADPGNDGVAVLADAQTAGRGQHGRSWLCPPGAGVLLSVLLFPPPALRRPAILTAWAAVSVCEVIREIAGLQAQIKWPNDVLIQGRKVCGILIEQAAGTVAGIGLNINQGSEVFTVAGLPDAASLAVFAGRTFDRDEVARRLIHTLDAEYNALVEGEFAGLEARWQDRLGLSGAAVTAECHSGEHRGRLLAVAFDGVVLESPAGETLRFAPEMVRHLRRAD